MSLLIYEKFLQINSDSESAIRFQFDITTSCTSPTHHDNAALLALGAAHTDAFSTISSKYFASTFLYRLSPGVYGAYCPTTTIFLRMHISFKCKRFREAPLSLSILPRQASIFRCLYSGELFQSYVYFYRWRLEANRERMKNLCGWGLSSMLLK